MDFEAIRQLFPSHEFFTRSDEFVREASIEEKNKITEAGLTVLGLNAQFNADNYYYRVADMFGDFRTCDIIPTKADLDAVRAYSQRDFPSTDHQESCNAKILLIDAEEMHRLGNWLSHATDEQLEIHARRTAKGLPTVFSRHAKDLKPCNLVTKFAARALERAVTAAINISHHPTEHAVQARLSKVHALRDVMSVRHMEQQFTGLDLT